MLGAYAGVFERCRGASTKRGGTSGGVWLLPAKNVRRVVGGFGAVLLRLRLW